MKTRCALLLSVTVALGLCAACGWWLHRERQQYALNRQLIDALDKGDTTMALALVNNGADPNTHQIPLPAPSLTLLVDQLLHHSLPANDSPTAFLFASGMEWTTVEHGVLIEIGCPENPQLVQAMLLRGADLQARTKYKRTALWIAVDMGYTNTVKVLLEHGANINEADVNGTTPLMQTQDAERPTLVHLLKQHGAK